MRYLALDIGRKHTGVAFCDSTVNIPLPLETIHHEDDGELVRAVSVLAKARRVNTLILGLPLMPGGEEGEEVDHVRAVASQISGECPAIRIEFLDERETSKGSQNKISRDPHALAALTLLRVFLARA